MKSRVCVRLLLTALLVQTSIFPAYVYAQNNNSEIILDDGDDQNRNNGGNRSNNPRPPRNTGIRLPGGPSIVTDNPITPSLPTIPINITLPDVSPGVPTPQPIVRPNPGTPGNTNPTPTPTPSPVRPNNPPNNRGMTGVTRSMVQGASCPLIDNRPYADLTAAVTNLYNNVNPVGDCSNDVNLSQVQKSLQAMQTAAAVAMGYWNNPDRMYLKPGANPEDPNLVQDPANLQANLATFETAVQSSITNLNTIATTLGNNAFVNSNCGKQLLSVPGVLKALGDVASSVSPLALLAVAANPANKPLLAAVMGTATFGAVSQVIKQVMNAGIMDMAKPENRLILLQNTCEFSKIAERVRYLKLAQAGQIEEVTKEIRMAKTNAEQALKLNVTPRLQQIILIRDSVVKELQDIADTLKADQVDMRALQQQMFTGVSTDNNRMCVFSRIVVRRSTDGQQFPLRAVENYKRLIKNQKEILINQEAVLAAEELFRTQILRGIENPNLNTAVCADLGRSYMASLEALLRETQTTIRAQQYSLRQKLADDPDAGPYQDKEDQINTESDSMTRILAVIERLKEDTAAPDKAEMNAQLAVLKSALFGTSRRWVVWSTESPVRSWLRFMDEEMRSAGTRMTKEWSALKAGACELTKSGCVMPMHPKSDFTPQWYLDAVSQYNADDRLTSKLENVTAAIAPVGSVQHSRICRRLENAYLEWISVWDFLAAQKLFCHVIEPLMDANVEKAVHTHCLDSITYAGQPKSPSLINKRIQELNTKGYQGRAELIISKINELGCTVDNQQND